MKDTFADYHPLINFIFFFVVIGISMFVTHPVFMGISFLAAFLYAMRLQGWKKTLKLNLFLMIPTMLIVTVINPMFNHYGVTILFYLDNGNPVTLESMVYGLVMAGMLAEVILWFACYNCVMTSDKFIYLFGRLIPGLSLVLSMCLRFVPKFIEHTKVISDGQKGIGRDLGCGSLFKRAKHGVTILSIMVTWSLENAIDTADSMKARGYGLKGRSAFAIFRFDGRDWKMLFGMGGLLSILVTGIFRGCGFARYNPRIVVSGLPLNLESAAVYLAYAMFCMLPVFLDMIETMRWKRLRERMEKEEKAGGYRLWDC